MIACLGWGSLVWDPGELPIRGTWFSDGPFVRVEFLRKSQDGRITLVLHESGTLVRSLWAPFAITNFIEAQEALAKRERTWSAHNRVNHIEGWATGDAGHANVVGLASWAQSHGMDQVIWTGLPPKFHEHKSRIPTSDEIVAYLASLRGPQRNVAEHYVRRTPPQIDTAIRRDIVAKLGWTAVAQSP